MLFETDDPTHLNPFESTACGSLVSIGPWFGVLELSGGFPIAGHGGMRGNTDKACVLNGVVWRLMGDDEAVAITKVSIGPWFGVLELSGGFPIAGHGGMRGNTDKARVLNSVVWRLMGDDEAVYMRRDRFILAAALSFGVGDLLVPDIFNYLFDGVNNPNNGLRGFFESITIVSSTPCDDEVLGSCRTILNSWTAVLISGLVALTPNLLLPQDGSPKDEVEENAEVAQDLEIQMLYPERKP
ncbi:hypothetical protein K503DRAFT_865274 [Rhizopogon vinicolor AM-OR11-026]|uniref:Uncharacterized protein n=1 Tax=Rhizopogon vinicolor AM-OR11-026 TaxID=1314800 RepID=A0A1B7N415_9AGAM|nr:hypothetical protein K503DRAFT_865274 [Rhizopogon vinicolor AM-OR11-026]